ncbi:unnamed protein product, partial [marine sediment metagenome]
QGTEPGKTRPVVVVQTNLINDNHLSTIICPVTTNISKGAEILRINLDNKINGLNKNSDILVDQLRAIDNKRFIKLIGKLNRYQKRKLLESLKIIILE